MKPSPSQRLSESNGLGGSGRIDGRSTSAKRLKRLLWEFERAYDTINPLPSITQQQMLKRCASLSLLAEGLESRLAAGHAVDPDGLVRVSSTLSRLCGKLGLHAGPQPHKPATLEEMFGEEAAPVSAFGRKAVDADPDDPDDLDDLDDDDVRDFEPKPVLASRIKRSKIKRRKVRA